MKYSFIYQKWWKILGLIILLYVFIAGFLVPLRPGILDVTEFQLQAGQPYDINVSTYNAHLNLPGKKLSAYIKADSISVTQVPYVMVTGRNEVNIRGTLPDASPSSEEWTDATLILHDDVDGYLILPSAFVIEANTSPSSTSEATWNDNIGVYDQQWTFRFPFMTILYETVRNTFFHVATWMAMFVLLIISLIYSIIYLRTSNIVHDAVAASFTHVAVLFGTLGMITGSIWARSTWGAYWPNDPKTNMSAVAMMIYLAYTILRASMADNDKRAKVCASYNIFAFVAMIPLVLIIPRLMDGVHPGNGGNPALGGEDLDNTMKFIFYPAIIGYTLLGVWLSAILFRIRHIEIRRINQLLNL